MRAVSIMHGANVRAMEFDGKVIELNFIFNCPFYGTCSSVREEEALKHLLKLERGPLKMEVSDELLGGLFNVASGLLAPTVSLYKPMHGMEAKVESSAEALSVQELPGVDNNAFSVQELPVFDGNAIRVRYVYVADKRVVMSEQSKVDPESSCAGIVFRPVGQLVRGGPHTEKDDVQAIQHDATRTHLV